MYRLRFLADAERDLNALDRSVSVRILRKLEWLAQNTEQIVGEALRSELSGLMKLREGDYRILYNLDRNEKVVIVAMISHRSGAYKR